MGNCQASCSQLDYNTTCDVMETRYNDKCISSCPDTPGYDCSKGQYWGECSSNCDIIENCRGTCAQSFSFSCSDMDNYAIWTNCPQSPRSVSYFFNEVPATDSIYYPTNKFKMIDELRSEDCADIISVNECRDTCMIVDQCSESCANVLNADFYRMQSIWVDRCHPDNNVAIAPLFYDFRPDKRADYELPDSCKDIESDVISGEYTKVNVDELCTASVTKPWVDMIAQKGTLGLNAETFNTDANGAPVIGQYHFNEYDQSDKFVGAYFNEAMVNKEFGEGPFQMENVPFESLTHLFYGSFPICAPYDLFPQNAICKYGKCIGANAEDHLINFYNACNYPCSDWDVTLRDPYASLTGTCRQTTGSNNFGKLTKMKEKDTFKTKIIASIGGPALSKPFYHMDNVQYRSKFILSVKTLLESFDGIFDGISIDWQYPGGGGLDTDGYVKMEAIETEAGSNNLIRPKPTENAIRRIEQEGSDVDIETLNFLVKELREMLNSLGQCEVKDLACIGATVDSEKACKCKDKYYELSVTVPPFETMINKVNYVEVARYVDHLLFNAMDYANGNNMVHHSNVFNVSGANTTSVESGIDTLISQGVNSTQIILGFSTYGRGWHQVDENSGSHNIASFIDEFGNTVEEINYFDGSYQNGIGWVTRDQRLDENGEGGQAQGFADYSTIAKMVLNKRCDAYFDQCSGASFAVCEKSIEGYANVITYESPRSVVMKGLLGISKGVGGFFAKDIDGDDGDIINAMNEACGNVVKENYTASFGEYIANGYTQPDTC